MKIKKKCKYQVLLQTLFKEKVLHKKTLKKLDSLIELRESDFTNAHFKWEIFKNLICTPIKQHNIDIFGFFLELTYKSDTSF